MRGMLTVTDGRNTIQIPYREGETVLAALQRELKFPAPCHGNGTCGQCLCHIVRPDGTLKPELACMVPAKEMTVRVRLIRPKERV